MTFTDYYITTALTVALLVLFWPYTKKVLDVFWLYAEKVFGFRQSIKRPSISQKITPEERYLKWSRGQKIVMKKPVKDLSEVVNAADSTKGPQIADDIINAIKSHFKAENSTYSYSDDGEIAFVVLLDFADYGISEAGLDKAVEIINDYQQLDDTYGLWIDSLTKVGNVDKQDKTMILVTGSLSRMV